MDNPLDFLQTLSVQLEACSDSLVREVDSHKSDDHLALIRYYDQFRRVAERFSQAKKVITELNDRLSRDYVPEAMKLAGVKTTNVVGVGRVTVSAKFGCTMTDKAGGMAWLRENGHGDLIQQTVNSSTLSAFAKNMMVDEGKDLPPNLFKTGTVPYTSITKA